MPIFNSTNFIKYTDIPKSSALRLIKDLVNKKIIFLIKEGKGRVPNTYTFNKLIQIVEGKV